MDEEAATDGLRERKKRETRSALAWAAVRLAIKRGFANVSVEDIAAAADVSPRTFNNYFSSKAEAIVARYVDHLQAITAEFDARPPEEDVWSAVGAAAISQFRGQEAGNGPPRGRWAAGIKLMLGEPAVQAEFLRQSRIVERDIAAAIAKRINSDADALYPQLVAAAVGTVIRVSLEQWLRANQPHSLPQILQNALKRMGGISNSTPSLSGTAPIARARSARPRISHGRS